MMPHGMAPRSSHGTGDVELGGCSQVHLTVRSDHDTGPKARGEPRGVDRPLQARALADVDAHDVGSSGADDAFHIGGGVDRFVGDDRDAQRAHLAHPLEVVRRDGLLDECDLELGEARHGLERHLARPAAVRVDSEQRSVPDELARQPDAGDVGVGIAPDLDLERPEAEPGRGRVARLAGRRRRR